NSRKMKCNVDGPKTKSNLKSSWPVARRDRRDVFIRVDLRNPRSIPGGTLMLADAIRVRYPGSELNRR
ncbi:MAG TPA: hypothetical protein VL069_01340, partial [Opitutus sp.]|nr:hypothetical protein [Opitutus sp.]